MRAADLLTIVRLATAVALPVALARGGMLPVLLWCVAAATDYVDGPIARRSGSPSRHGVALDNVADVAVVLGGLGAAAALGRVPWLVPAAILLAVVDYARASFEERRGMVAAQLARSRLGHAAGVTNYACLGVVCAAVAWPERVPAMVVIAVELATITMNLLAVVGRALRRRPAQRQPADNSRAARRRKTRP